MIILKNKSYFFRSLEFIYLMIKRKYRYWKTSVNLILIFHNIFMTDPILYLSMILGLGGVYVLISSFHDDDDDDGEGFFISSEILT